MEYSLTIFRALLFTGQLFLPCVVLALLCFLIVVRRRNLRLVVFSISFSFAVTGAAIGHLTGSSQSPVVGAIVPAALTLIGGVSLLAVRGSTIARMLSGISMLCFSSALLYGVHVGSETRVLNDRAALTPSAILADTEREFLRRQFRSSLGLDGFGPILTEQ